MDKKVGSIVLFVMLALMLNVFAASASQLPTLTATKTINPSTILVGDTTTISFNLEGTGTPVETRNHLDVVLVLDKSGSMGSCALYTCTYQYKTSPSDSWHSTSCTGVTTCVADECNMGATNTRAHSTTCSQTKLSLTKTAASTFIDQLDSTYDRAGLVGFPRYSSPPYVGYLYNGLTSNFANVKNSINGFSSGGNTPTADAIAKANNELISNSPAGNVKVEVLLSDGLANVPTGTAYQDAYNNAAQAASHGIIIYTISLGNDADQTFMQNIADATGGKHYHAPSASDLQAIFLEIAGEVSNLVGSEAT